MIKQVTTLIIDHDQAFIELVKNAIERTDNLTYIGSSPAGKDFEKLCHKINPVLVLLNIDLQNSNANELSINLKECFPDSCIILMNLDDKKFASYTPDEKVADDYLDKHILFEEIQKISKYFNEKPELNKVMSIT